MIKNFLEKFRSIALHLNLGKTMSEPVKSRCSVRCVESDPNIIISFKYSNNSMNERFFHFKREKNEKLKQTFARISLNVNNLLTKKLNKRNKSKEKVETITEPIVTQLLIDGREVSGELENIEVWKKGAILRIGETQYEVIINQPTVKSIKLAKYIMSGFTIYPILSLEFCTYKECQYIWFKQRLPHEKVKKWKKVDNCQNDNTGNGSEKSDTEEEVIGFGGWIRVGDQFYYNTSCDDIGRKLKVVCVPNNGFESECVSSVVVEANPGICPFDERHVFCNDITHLNSFRVISYNILADMYADTDYTRTILFPYCPAYALKTDYRKQLLIKEITGYNGDIYCLQEVDRDVFEYDLNPMMSFKDYISVFSEKGDSGEGLAAIFRPSKFELLENETISISEEFVSNPIFAQLCASVSTNHLLLERLLTRKSVFQCILLKKSDSTNKTILLGNTHLYFHPDADHIRLIQSYIYVKFIENYIKTMEQKRPELKISPIICGDFNSCPEFGVYQLMTQGFVDKNVEDFKSNIEETIEGFEMKHSLSLGSACGRPLYTNFTQGFNGCLDYIYYDTNSLNVSEVVPFPTHEQVIQNTAIPSIVFPSDHLALVCTLSWDK